MNQSSPQTPPGDAPLVVDVPVLKRQSWLEARTIALLDDALERTSSAGPFDAVAFSCFATTGQKIRIDPICEYVWVGDDIGLAEAQPEILDTSEPRRSRLALGAVALGQDVGIFSLLRRVSDLYESAGTGDLRLFVFRDCALAYAQHRPTPEQERVTGKRPIPVLRALLPPLTSRHAELTASQVIERALCCVTPIVETTSGQMAPKFSLIWPDTLD